MVFMAICYIEPVNVIALKKLREFWASDPLAERPLRRWHKLARHLRAKDFGQVREVFGDADLVGAYLVFNAGGNKYRVVVAFSYELQTFWIKAVFTHKAYDRWSQEQR
jgi:mRNA interferase HigB